MNLIDRLLTGLPDGVVQEVQIGALYQPPFSLSCSTTASTFSLDRWSRT
jgi:hypothetical protein